MSIARSCNDNPCWIKRPPSISGKIIDAAHQDTSIISVTLERACRFTLQLTMRLGHATMSSSAVCICRIRPAAKAQEVAACFVNTPAPSFQALRYCWALMASNGAYVYNEIHFEVEYWDNTDPFSMFMYPDGSLNLDRATSFNVLVLRYYSFYDTNACIVFQFNVYHPVMTDKSAIEVFQDMVKLLTYLKFDVLVAHLMPDMMHIAFPVTSAGVPYLRLPDPRKWQRFMHYMYGNICAFPAVFYTSILSGSDDNTSAREPLFVMMDADKSLGEHERVDSWRSCLQEHVLPSEAASSLLTSRLMSSQLRGYSSSLASKCSLSPEFLASLLRPWRIHSSLSPQRTHPKTLACRKILITVPLLTAVLAGPSSTALQVATIKGQIKSSWMGYKT